MRVLTVYAHPNPNSFCHALLERFTAGLQEAGHETEVLDLYAENFNPVFGMKDYAFFAHESLPPEVIAAMDPRQRVERLAGGPIKRWLARWMIRNKTDAEVLEFIRSRAPKDVLRHQELVASADGLAFIAPIYWMSFPAILKGWIDRVFSYGFAYTLSPEGWQGDLDGRVALLQHQKALIMSTTFFKRSDFEQGFEQAILTTIDQWCFQYPGIQNVEHAWFHSVRSVDDARRTEFLQEAFRLGKDFAT